MDAGHGRRQRMERADACAQVFAGHPVARSMPAGRRRDAPDIFGRTAIDAQPALRPAPFGEQPTLCRAFGFDCCSRVDP